MSAPVTSAPQVIHMLKGVSSPGPAFQLDPVRGAYLPAPGVHLHSSSHGSARVLLQRFAATATAVRRVQAFCSAAVRAGGGRSGSAAGEGADEEDEGQEQEERALHSLPTVAAFAAAVAEQQQGLQQQLVVIEAAFSSGALLSLLQLQQRTACLAEQAGALAAMARRCCCWRGSPAETSAALLTGLYEALQLQLLQARSQGEPASQPAMGLLHTLVQRRSGFGVQQQLPHWQAWVAGQHLMPLQFFCVAASAREPASLAGGVLAAMLLRVFTAACRPLLAALHKWLYRGVLDDPASEFFIQASGEAPAAAAVVFLLLAAECLAVPALQRLPVPALQRLPVPALQRLSPCQQAALACLAGLALLPLPCCLAS